MTTIKKPYLIAEIGINHNGDIKIAKELIDISKEAGFDAVKFQKRDINIVYTKNQLDTPRESPWGNTTRHQKEGLEFGIKEYDEINNYCKDKSIDWFASAWDLNSLSFLDKYKLKYNKIASAMIIDKFFLEEVAKRKKHTFISTGMSTEKDIDDAVKIFLKNKCSFELMHCVSTYPLKKNMVNMSTITELKKKFKCNVGYSGHEPGLAISNAAAAFGITSLERHITLGRAMYGSDQAASLEPAGLTQLVGAIRKIELALGDGIKKTIEDELPVAENLRQHLDWKW